jgi:hypothetical protein
LSCATDTTGFPAAEPGVALYTRGEAHRSAIAVATRAGRMRQVDGRMPLVDHGCPSQCIAKRYDKETRPCLPRCFM